MEHTFYFDGNKKMISWVIENSKIKFEQTRNQAEYYYDKVSVEQAKYISFHVGIFWGIGRFIIKNGDTVRAMHDQSSMFEHLTKNKKHADPFIESRIGFIKQLLNQRNLDLCHQLIEPKRNQASRLLSLQ
jgi:hypothetical protein